MDPVSLVLFATDAIVEQRKKIAKGNCELDQTRVRQWEVCLESLREANSSCHAFSASERKYFGDTLFDIQEALRMDLIQTLRRITGTGTIPRSLHMEHVPGCLTYDRVGSKCDFQVRASTYLSNSKKTNSESPLFVQRSIQIMHSEHFHSHVARHSWCALPPNEPDNFFFVITYILPGTPRIHVVCVYMATPDAADVIRKAHDTLHQRTSTTTASTTATNNNNSNGLHHHRHHHHLFTAAGTGSNNSNNNNSNNNNAEDDDWSGWRGLVARMFVGHTVLREPSDDHQHHHQQQQPEQVTTTGDTGDNNTTAAVHHDSNLNSSSVCDLSASDIDVDFINRRLKLIPTMVEANWAVKMAVGQRPALLGTKLPLRYYKGRNYVEMDIDLSTSSIATGIMGMVTGLSKNMVVNLGWTLQGETTFELPERILCQTRFDHVDLEDGANLE